MLHSRLTHRLRCCYTTSIQMMPIPNLIEFHQLFPFWSVLFCICSCVQLCECCYCNWWRLIIVIDLSLVSIYLPEHDPPPSPPPCSLSTALQSHFWMALFSCWVCCLKLCGEANEHTGQWCTKCTIECSLTRDFCTIQLKQIRQRSNLKCKKPPPFPKVLFVSS